MNKSPQYWLSINYTEHYGNPNCPPRRNKNMLVRAALSLNVIYWGDGPQHMTMGKSAEIEIVKNYGRATEDFGRSEAELLHIQDNPPVAEDPLKLSYGWVSPEGEWFTCGYGGHSGLADDLHQYFYQCNDDNYRNQEGLRSKGWIQVTDAHIGSDLPATEQQKETLTKLLSATGEPDYVAGYKRAYENYFDIWAIKMRRENAVHNGSEAPISTGASN